MVPIGRRPGTRPKSPKLAAAHAAAEVKIATARAFVQTRVKQMQAAAHARIAAQRAARVVKRDGTRGTNATPGVRPSLARAVGGAAGPQSTPKPARARTSVSPRRR